MRLIEHIIFSDMDEDHKIMINSLNGSMDKVDSKAYETIAKWRKQDSVAPMDSREKSLYEALGKKGYLVSSREEEQASKARIIGALRKNHEELKKNPTSLMFVMTYDCNFRCAYCFEGSCKSAAQDETSRHAKETVISKQQVDSAFRLANGAPDSITLFGGEPLLPKNEETVEYIVSKAPNATYSVITNGFYLRRFFGLLSKVKIGMVMATLDGEEETHNSRRHLAGGKPTYEAILTGIAKCLENDIPTRIRMNVDESNIESCMRLRDEMQQRFREKLELLSFEISPMMHVDWQERNATFLSLFDEDRGLPAEQRRKSNSMFGAFSPIINAVTAGERLRPVYSFCHAHDSGYIVDPLGNIYPCVLAVGKEELAIGTYFPDTGFRENSIRNRNIETIPECRSCTYSLLCGGGCALSLDGYSDFFRPVCFNIKNQIHNLLPAFLASSGKQAKESCGAP